MRGPEDGAGAGAGQIRLSPRASGWRRRILMGRVDFPKRGTHRALGQRRWTFFFLTGNDHEARLARYYGKAVRGRTCSSNLKGGRVVVRAARRYWRSNIFFSVHPMPGLVEALPGQIKVSGGSLRAYLLIDPPRGAGRGRTKMAGLGRYIGANCQPGQPEALPGPASFRLSCSRRSGPRGTVGVSRVVAGGARNARPDESRSSHSGFLQNTGPQGLAWWDAARHYVKARNVLGGQRAKKLRAGTM